MKRQKKAKLSSVQIIALGFFIMIGLGTALLMLPLSSQAPGGASFLDALFTATSASCVTGLVPQDTGTYWTTFGQTVIILLIQTGGLGFMSIATLFLLLLRKRLGLRQREVVVDSVSYDRLGGFVPFIRLVFLGTFLAEGLGAVLLSIRFVPQFGWGRGIYYGVWHSVSAFRLPDGPAFRGTDDTRSLRNVLGTTQGDLRSRRTAPARPGERKRGGRKHRIPDRPGRPQRGADKILLINTRERPVRTTVFSILLPCVAQAGRLRRSAAANRPLPKSV